MLDEVIDEHVVGTGTATGVEQSIVPALVSFDFHVDKQGELFWRKALFGFFDDLLHSLYVSHDAGDHEGSQLFYADLT